MQNPNNVIGFAVFIIIGPFLLLPGFGQEQSAAQATDQETWSIHFQTTSIGQYHDNFFSLYEGVNSLPSHPETRMSFTATVFGGLRLTQSTEIIIDPELSAGRGF